MKKIQIKKRFGDYGVRSYAKARGVTQQAVQRTIKRFEKTKNTLPYANLPGVVLIYRPKNGNYLIQATASKITKGRAKKYIK